MLKLISFLIQFLILLSIVFFLVANSFIISFDIGDYKYSFSSNIFFGSIITLLFVLYILQYLYFKTRLNLHRYIISNKYKKLEKGYSSFVDAMISIANKDNKIASTPFLLPDNKINEIEDTSITIEPNLSDL